MVCAMGARHARPMGKRSHLVVCPTVEERLVGVQQCLELAADFLELQAVAPDYLRSTRPGAGALFELAALCRTRRADLTSLIETLPTEVGNSSD